MKIVGWLIEFPDGRIAVGSTGQALLYTTKERAEKAIAKVGATGKPKACIRGT